VTRLVDAVVELDGRRLTTRTWGDGPPSIVMLHDGLGSISQWRDLPACLHRSTGWTVLAYDRAGHGDSRPVPTGAWPADWLHTEADVLAALLATGSDRPLLVGHSDGASIALIHAAGESSGLSGVVALAPHTFVEQKCVDAIARLTNEPERLVDSLGRHHADAAALFRAWSGVWVSEGFGPWDIRGRLAEVTVPTLVLQGDRDEYASDAMLWETLDAIGPEARGRLLAGLGHGLHREAPELVCELVSGFLSPTTHYSS
jgi:pimeloyl-ACP methyl ester carboxylesterase